jgi:hypothetical protein
MKGKNIIMLMGLIATLASCKKENKYPIVGKWQQIKLHTYTQSYSGVVSNDTTYQESSFKSNNYAQFNNDGTCIIGIFYPPGFYYLNIAQASTQTYNYARVGSKYVMTQPIATTNPGGFTTTDTASLNNNTLLIHAVFDNHQNLNISDSYYTK